MALLLEACLVAAHRVEGRARELARVALDVPQVPGQLPELREGARSLAGAHRQLREPCGVEGAGFRRRPRLVGRADVPEHQVARHLQVLVDGLPGDQQVHDLRRPLEDAVDAHVAQHLLGRYRLLPPPGERLRGLVSAAAADLDHLVGGGPAELRPVELRERGLDADVVALVVGQAAGHVEHRLEAERRARQPGEFLRDRVVLADGLAPLRALGRPLARDLERVLGRRNADRRQ